MRPDSIGPRDPSCLRPLHAAGRGLANPAVARARFDGRSGTACRGQALPGRVYVLGQVVMRVRQSPFSIAAHVEQEPANQEKRHVRANVFLELGCLVLEGFRKLEW